MSTQIFRMFGAKAGMPPPGGTTILLVLDPALTPVIKRRKNNTATTVEILVNKDTKVEITTAPSDSVVIRVPTEGT